MEESFLSKETEEGGGEVDGLLFKSLPLPAVETCVVEVLR